MVAIVSKTVRCTDGEEAARPPPYIREESRRRKCLPRLTATVQFNVADGGVERVWLTTSNSR